MKPQISKIPRIASILVLFSFCLWFLQGNVYSATGINKQINFQGKVVNTDGTNVTTGSYTFLFCIYTTASPDTACTSGADNDAIWRESKSITVTDGIFRTALGDTISLPGSVDFNTDNIYLGVNFNADGQMSPLVRFTAVPYAFNALKVAGLTVTDTTGTFTLTAGKTLSVANSLSFAGTDSTTITFQGTDTYVGRATEDVLTNKSIGSTGLTFSGATTDVTTGTNEALTFAPNGSGDVVIDTDSDTTLTLNGGGDGVDSLILTDGDILLSDGDFDISGGDFNVILDAGDGALIDGDSTDKTADAFTVDVGTLTDGVDGIVSDLNVTGNTGNDADSFASIRVIVSNNATDQTTDDNIYGIVVADLGGTALDGNEYGIYQAGTGWDFGLYVEDAAHFNSTVAVTSTLDANGQVDLGDGGDALTINGTTVSILSTGAGNDITINSVDQIVLTDFTNGGSGCSALETDASGNLTCGSDAGGNTPWDDIGDPDAGASIAFAEYAQTMDWNMATDVAKTALSLTLTNDVAGSNTQYLFYLDNVDDAGSNGVTESLLVLDNSDANEAVTDGLLFVDAGGGFTDYIDTPSSVFKVAGTGALTALGATFNGNVDLTSDLILNIGDTGTDFTAGGGLTLAELLTVNDDVDINLAAGENFNLAATAAPTVDLLNLTNSGFGTTTDTADGLSIDYTVASDGGGDTNAGAHITITDSGDTGDTISGLQITAGTAGAGTQYGVNIEAITGGGGTEYGLVIGSGWDRGLSVASASTFTSTLTSEGTLVVGSGGNTFTFDPSSGPLYALTARPTKRITLSPEYAGATFTADGGSNTGSMTSDNMTSSPYRNYYKWTNTQGTAQDYDIWVRIPLPADFSAMAATPTLSIDTYTSDTTNGTVTATVYDTNNSADCTSASFTPSSSSTWETKTQTTCLDTGTYSANGVMTIAIKITGAATTGDTRISTIYFDYLAKF